MKKNKPSACDFWGEVHALIDRLEQNQEALKSFTRLILAAAIFAFAYNLGALSVSLAVHSLQQSCPCVSGHGTVITLDLNRAPDLDFNLRNGYIPRPPD